MLQTVVQMSYQGLLQRTDLKGNKNYFELARGSSYHGFELPWVKLQ